MKVYDILIFLLSSYSNINLHPPFYKRLKEAVNRSYRIERCYDYYQCMKDQYNLFDMYN